MKFEKTRAGTKTEISTASMPDIIFMLLLFFMVATTMREQEIFVKFVLPEAKAVQKIENKRLVSYIWVGDNERIQIDDNIVELKQIQKIMYDKRVILPNVIVSLRVDKNSNMGLVTDIQQSLRKADARRINYSARSKL
ncbi:MAG: biopolymer transporter ExbD [Ignavibacteriae bacterium]|nr:biopolymer transporter ExbD [Ignavibacteriota bacterium]MCB9206916.1 biopolymer transporter ExbD [Ignavibacteriales bacterium]MCB9209824.1 biopolymer transporter ExbD [Ignavibacteriales bacterium]MCB9218980.1 biopolymer transporter ExbD [Ignavibacteriales bacterium]